MEHSDQIKILVAALKAIIDSGKGDYVDFVEDRDLTQEINTVGCSFMSDEIRRCICDIIAGEGICTNTMQGMFRTVSILSSIYDTAEIMECDRRGGKKDISVSCYEERLACSLVQGNLTNKSRYTINECRAIFKSDTSIISGIWASEAQKGGMP